MTVVQIRGDLDNSFPTRSDPASKPFKAKGAFSQEKGVENSGNWFARLGAFFDERFGSGWKTKDKKFWNEFDKTFKVSKDEIEKIM